jgi:hypothetical protein
MTSRPFDRDDAWQRAMRDRFLPRFYLTQGNDFVFQPHTADWNGPHPVDTLWLRRGQWLRVEEKIVRFLPDRGHYEAYALETHSCTVPGRERWGWMKTSTADLLAYAFDTGKDLLRLHLIPLAALKAWFWPRVERFPVSISPQINRTHCRIVPIVDVIMGLCSIGAEIERFKLRPLPQSVAA